MKRKDINEEVILGTREIMRRAKEESGTTQKALAERLGMLQTSVSAGFARDHISLELFSRYMDGMGYAVAVIGKRDGNVRWVVDPDDKK